MLCEISRLAACCEDASLYSELAVIRVIAQEAPRQKKAGGVLPAGANA